MRSSNHRETALPGIKPRDTHRHECGHFDICLLSDEDAQGSDCRRCRAEKFNREAPLKTSRPPAHQQPAGAG